MSKRYPRRKLHGGLGLLVLVLAIILAGCSDKTPAGKDLVLDPRAGVTKTLGGDLYTSKPDQAISPGGDYILAERGDDAGSHMVAVPLKEGSDREVVLNSISGEESGGYTRQVPVGWTSPTTCVFLVTGPQVHGPNKGKQGVAIMLGDVKGPKAEELAFIELETGFYRSITFVEDESKVYVHVSRALWEYDLGSRTLRLVKDNLPTYDGLFIVKVSPAGKYAVYELYEEDKQGIYVLDMATGEERALLPTGETMSFLPQWSPDGKYVLAYTAGQKPGGADLPSWERYEVFQGEDSALPIAAKLTVVTPEGEVRKTVQVEGKLLAHARWARNSEAVGFLTGVPRNPEYGQRFAPDARPGALSYDGAMVADISGDAAAVRVADFSALSGYDDPSIDMVLVDPSGKGLYFVASRLVNSSLQGSKLWYASRDKEPAPVCDGLWQYAGTEPVYGDHVVGILSDQEETTVWLVGPEDSRPIATAKDVYSWTKILGWDENLLVIGNWVYSDGGETITVIVYRMYTEVKKAG